MKQILQNLKTGEVQVVEVPVPLVRSGHLVIQTRASLISAGTERMLVEFGKSSLIGKAKAQPDKVKQVLDKIKTDGLMPTMEAVFSRLDEPLPLGYCNAGVVAEVGEGVTGFKVGDRVISNGPHAEVVCVAQNLCARIPDGISDEQAAFTVLSSIGLQGIRLVNPSIGDAVAVVGLGLIGLITVQLLIANGSRVLGIDINPDRLEMARSFGAKTVHVGQGEDPVAKALSFTGGHGVDAVLITASTKSNQVISQAAQMSRQRGSIVLVGVVGLELNRSDFYKKELRFQVSCSYGPGRYDPFYEDQGHDYPYGFVRWTQQRNFQAILSLLERNRLNVDTLISKRIVHEDAQEAYQNLTGTADTLGVILTYPTSDCFESVVRTVNLEHTCWSAQKPHALRASGAVNAGVIGAGTFVKRTLLPALKGIPVQLTTIASAGGVSSVHSGKKFGFKQATSDYHTILNDENINLVFIMTRHNQHAHMIQEALEAGKHVIVEKPLCLNNKELEQIRRVYESHPELLLCVGFNRRYSPHVTRMKSLLAGRNEPLTMCMMVNAGITPSDSWLHDPEVGGGRIIGEGCHWIDLMMYLAGARITTVTAMRIGESPALDIRDDKISITLRFADGSVGTLHYFGNGDKSYSKERLEVFGDGRVLLLDNFRKLKAYGWPGFSSMKTRQQDKGHSAQFRTFIEAVSKGGYQVMRFDEIDNVMRATFAAVESAHTGSTIEVPQK